MDKPTPVRMAFVEDSLAATKAYEQARRALLTQLRWELQRRGCQVKCVTLFISAPAPQTELRTG